MTSMTVSGCCVRSRDRVWVHLMMVHRRSPVPLFCFFFVLLLLQSESHSWTSSGAAKHRYQLSDLKLPQPSGRCVPVESKVPNEFAAERDVHRIGDTGSLPQSQSNVQRASGKASRD